MSSTLKRSRKRTNDSTDGVGSQVSSSLQNTVSGWRKCLFNDNDAKWIANVACFKNAPFASRWNEFAKLGVIVEVPISLTPFSDHLPVYWFGKVIYFAGYYGLVEFLPIEGDTGPKSFMWIPFFTHLPKPFGYCLKTGILLHPPSKSLIPDLTNHVMKTVQCLMANEVESLPQNHLKTFKDKIEPKRFKINEIVEALDRTNCAQFRIARVNIIVGDRMQVSYCDMSKWDEGFWFSQNSSEVHRLGWCQAVGAKLVGAPENFIYPIPELSEFASVPGGPEEKFEVDMIFEMRHPVLPHKMVCGYVAHVLSHGYFLAATDWTDEKELVGMVMHISSDYIFPVNFCRDHRINLVPPYDKKETQPKIFSWREYLQQNSYKALPLRLKNVINPFTRGLKLEAANILCPGRLYSATVTLVAGHLIRIHFDGLSRFEETSYQWVSCQSPNIYPAGYSEIIGFKLAGPTKAPNPLDQVSLDFKRKNVVNK